MNNEQLIERLNQLEEKFGLEVWQQEDSREGNDYYEDDGFLHFRVNGQSWGVDLGQELPVREFNREVVRICDFLEIPRNLRGRLRV